MEVNRNKWEKIAQGTWRLVVPGGWLYRYEKEGICMCFVPSPPSESR